eukprot:m.164370 g.164370  ORF g.164370 m.164370 type:complete len:58 (-) comp14400_c0_seq8:2664-2837(-)
MLTLVIVRVSTLCQSPLTYISVLHVRTEAQPPVHDQRRVDVGVLLLFPRGQHGPFLC